VPTSLNRLFFFFLMSSLIAVPQRRLHSQTSWLLKADRVVQYRATLLTGRSRIVMRATSTLSLATAESLVLLSGGTLGRALPIINARVADVPNAAIATIAASTAVGRLSIDRLSVAALERTGATIGAAAARADFGYDGTGITVATIDSGIPSWHDDMAAPGGSSQRVDRFVDFVNGRTQPYDDYGHGAHVGGIIAGNGFDSSGRRSGIAPAARLVALKVLDSTGQGRVSDVIAAIDYAVTHRDELHIRVINLSVATPVYESYATDPLTLAAQRAVAAGIVVVAAAGNNGRSSTGVMQYGGITSPGNAPWVLTVGASSHMGTTDRADDTIAAFSSRGPTAVDDVAKPDIVAPGVGIESIVTPETAFYSTKSAYLLDGTISTPYRPYLSLSGTSMAAPVVSGTVALMLQANPSLTPNAVKAILQYTSQIYPSYDRLTQGAGFLNAEGAIAVARALAAGTTYAAAPSWTAEIIWGNRVYDGGPLRANAAEWSTSVTWGQTAWIESGWTASSNVVWGMTCGGDDCHVPWTTTTSGAPIYGADDSETVVWGTADDDSTVVWGTSCSDPSCTPVIWNP
jgi:serine protease AprX